MIVPQFLRFYGGYKASDVMDEYAVTFFSLVNSMYRLQPDEMITAINSVAVGMADPKDRSNILTSLEKSAQGLHGILKEVRNVKG